MSQNDRTTGLVGNAGMKVPVLAATTAAITLSGEQTIDGVACVTDDRVLVKDQASGVNNGIYVVDTGTWERAKDADGPYDFVEGSVIKVNQGSTNQGFWYLSTTGTITPGTTSLTFAKASTILAVVSTFIQTLLDDADAATARTTLGAVGLTGNETVAGNKTFSGTTTFAAATALQALLDISHASAGQIKFPATQNASSNANTLDDYEEGTWSPSVGGNATYTNQIGRYVKIGKYVWVFGRLTVNVLGTGSTTTITNAPFAAASMATDQPGCVSYWAGLAANVLMIGSIIENASANIKFSSEDAAGTASSNGVGIFGNSADISFSIFYESAG